MRQGVNIIKRLLDECSEQDRNAWHSQTQTILGAIHASHPTRRGVHTAIASAFFEKTVLPDIAGKGWRRLSALSQNVPFAVVIENNARKVRILIATLEIYGGKHWRRFSQDDGDGRYVVRLRRNPNRPRRGSKPDPAASREPGVREPLRTRAWSFDEFDILAVNTQLATRQWTDFRYALSRTLLPGRDPALIASPQPVSLERSTVWVKELGTCLDRFLTTRPVR